MSIAFPRTKAQWPKMNKYDVENTEKEASEHIETDLATGPMEGSEPYIEKTKVERTLLWKADLVILPLSAIAWWVTYLVRYYRLYVHETIQLTIAGPQLYRKCENHGSTERSQHDCRPILQLLMHVL